MVSPIAGRGFVTTDAVAMSRGHNHTVVDHPSPVHLGYAKDLAVHIPFDQFPGAFDDCPYVFRGLVVLRYHDVWCGQHEARYECGKETSWIRQSRDVTHWIRIIASEVGYEQATTG